MLTVREIGVLRGSFPAKDGDSARRSRLRRLAMAKFTVSFLPVGFFWLRRRSKLLIMRELLNCHLHFPVNSLPVADSWRGTGKPADTTRVASCPAKFPAYSLPRQRHLQISGKIL
jgi:hypothetical protein